MPLNSRRQPVYPAPQNASIPKPMGGLPNLVAQSPALPWMLMGVCVLSLGGCVPANSGTNPFVIAMKRSSAPTAAAAPENPAEADTGSDQAGDESTDSGELSERYVDFGRSLGTLSTFRLLDGNAQNDPAFEAMPNVRKFTLIGNRQVLLTLQDHSLHLYSLRGHPLWTSEQVALAWLGGSHEHPHYKARVSAHGAIIWDQHRLCVLKRSTRSGDAYEAHRGANVMAGGARIEHLELSNQLTAVYGSEHHLRLYRGSLAVWRAAETPYVDIPPLGEGFLKDGFTVSNHLLAARTRSAQVFVFNRLGQDVTPPPLGYEITQFALIGRLYLALDRNGYLSVYCLNHRGDGLEQITDLEIPVNIRFLTVGAHHFGVIDQDSKSHVFEVKHQRAVTSLPLVAPIAEVDALGFTGAATLVYHLQGDATETLHLRPLSRPDEITLTPAHASGYLEMLSESFPRVIRAH